MALALARKYRPRNFASVAVQTHVANTLKGAIARGRVAHGYLLCGPRGTGKTTLARVLAMALNCERRGDPALDGEPCGVCDSCSRIWAGSSSLDVVEIDAASNRGVDDARELRERAMYAPSGDDRYKVYIVDEAHMLTREAWNALLKILEEPPPRVVFVFATTEPQRIAQTAAPVLSRLQRFDLKRIGPAEIRERLAAVLKQEGVSFEDDALAMIARAADGGLRDALSLTDQTLAIGSGETVTADAVQTALGLVPDDEILALLDIIVDRRAADVFGAVQRLADSGVDFPLLLSGIGDALRAALAIELGGEPSEVPERMRAALDERRGRIGASDLLRMLTAMLEIEPAFRRSGQPQLLLETLLVRFALLDRTIELEEVLRGFGGEAGGRQDDPPRRVSREARGAAATASPASTLARTATAATAAPATTVAAPEAPARTAAPHASSSSGAPKPRTAGGAPSLPVATMPPGNELEAGAAPRAPKQPAPSSSPAVATHEGGPAEYRASSPTIDALREAWPRIADTIRQNGRGLLAQAFRRMVPSAVDAQGKVTLSYAPTDDTFARAVEKERVDVLAALQACVEGISTFAVRVQTSSGAISDPVQRLTQQEVTKQRTEQLQQRDPILDAAVRALDLELLD